MDGTLLNEDKEISDRCQELIKRLREMVRRLFLPPEGHLMESYLFMCTIIDLYDKDDYVVT